MALLVNRHFAFQNFASGALLTTCILTKRYLVFKKMLPAVRFWPLKMLMLNFEQTCHSRKKGILLSKNFACGALLTTKVVNVEFSVSDPDPFQFSHETDPGSKKSAWIMVNFHKKSTKITRILYTDPEQDTDPDPLFHETDLRIRIRIHIKMKRIRNTCRITYEKKFACGALLPIYIFY